MRSIGADTGLPGVAVKLRSQRALNGFIQTASSKTIKRRIAAQLSDTFLMSFGALFHISWRPISVEPVNLRLRTSGLLGQLSAADVASRTGNTPAEIPGAPGQPVQRQRGKRRLAGGFEYHCAACGQRAGRLCG